MAPGEAALTSTSSTLVEMTRHAMTTVLLGVTVTVETGGNAAVNGTGTRTESVAGPDLANAVATPVPGSEKGKGTDRSEQQTTTVVVTGVEIAKGSVGQHQEETAGAGRGVETGREGAGAEIVKETGTGLRGQKEGRRSAKEKLPPRSESACWRNTREKRVRA